MKAKKKQNKTKKHQNQKWEGRRHPPLTAGPGAGERGTDTLRMAFGTSLFQRAWGSQLGQGNLQPCLEGQRPWECSSVPKPGSCEVPAASQEGPVGTAWVSAAFQGDPKMEPQAGTGQRGGFFWVKKEKKNLSLHQGWRSVDRIQSL